MDSSAPIPWFGPELAGREETLLHDVLASGYLNDGQVTRQFEAEIARIVGTKHAVAVTSGTAAITLSLMAFGIGAGDEVIVPDLTFIATANAARLAGADVKLVDVDPVRLTINPAAVEAAIGPRTRAVIPVDVNGRSCDYAALEALCTRRGLVLICDSTEALGSRYGDKMLGSLGHAGCFSFSANKTICTGQGGMITTNDPKAHERLLELKDQGRRVQGTGGDDSHPVVGFNFKFTNLQAAVGLAQLDRLAERLAGSLRRDDWYREQLSNFREIEFPPVEAGEVLQWTDILSPRRAAIESALDGVRAGYRRFWFPLHRQQPYFGSEVDFPGSTQASDRGLWLPSNFSLTQQQVDAVSAAIRNTLS